MRFRPGLGLRVALVADLWVYLIGIVLFVLLPIFPVEVGERLTGNVIEPVEWALALLALVPAYGLAGRLIEKPHLWGNEWAYIATAFYGLIVLAAFLSVGRASVIVEPSVAGLVAVWFAGGAVGAAGAHIFDGSGSPLAPIFERWISEYSK